MLNRFTLLTWKPCMLV